jgi:hypothetical protein
MEKVGKMAYKTFAIDWDGTIIPDRQYPKIGEPKPNAIHVMQRIVDEGGRIVIWTCRGGMEQQEGIKNKLNEHGFSDFIVNEHFQDTIDAFDFASPKVFADIYIDDRSLFTRKIDWFEIENILFPEEDKEYGGLFEKYVDKNTK